MAIVELTGSAHARKAAKGLQVAAQGQAGTRVTRYTDHTGKEGWDLDVQGAGDVFFEEQIDAFIELTRRELSRKRPANRPASIDWAGRRPGERCGKTSDPPTERSPRLPPSGCKRLRPWSGEPIPPDSVAQSRP